MRAGSIAALAPVVGMACALALPQAAQGADYLRGSQIEQPMEPPPMFGGGRFDWSGFYFGGGAGVSETKFKPGEGLRALANSAFRNTDLAAERDMGSFINDLPDKRDSGTQFFGIAGYNYLFDDVVLGLEADYTRAGHEYRVSDFIARRSALSTGNVYDWSMATNQAAKLDDYATLRLRMGWAYGRIMPFATIGAALGRFNTTSTIDADALIVTNAGQASETRMRANGYPLQVGTIRKNTYAFGLSAGAGVDWALTDNLFLRAEYQIIRFAEIEGTTTTVNTGRVAAALKF
ncbi:outer membrane beta-barrel protein [Bosea vestrisii]|uniref:outer membrane protein n=1 Tax=Bosea vestrisii TaxID=151416 RepID=UPI0024E008CB|nr:outer membrane beta-barrel protein [Bosea vestrisii]WID96175.1 outer membrane beta-barrel protein [Bosea vestrisii]